LVYLFVTFVQDIIDLDFYRNTRVEGQVWYRWWEIPLVLFWDLHNKSFPEPDQHRILYNRSR